MVLLEQNSQRSNPFQAIILAIVFSNPLILSLKIQMQFTETFMKILKHIPCAFATLNRIS